MPLVVGIDPGNSGAFAVYDTTSGLIMSIADMPTWYQQIGKKKRPRIDAVAVAEMFDTFELMSVELVVIEAIGGRPKQSASGGFVLGYGVGLIYMAALYSKIPLETIPPTTWKKVMNVPGKVKAEAGAIIARADELFPQSRQLFRGPRSGEKLDRAEAAMLAKYGGDYVLRTMGGGTDIRNADTGA